MQFENDYHGELWTRFYCAALTGLLSRGTELDQAIILAASAADHSVKEIKPRFGAKE